MERQGSVTGILLGLRSDDQAVRDAAARQIWDRYFRDLLMLARKNFDKRIRLRADLEDAARSIRLHRAIGRAKAGSNPQPLDVIR
jgi:hypothetical protein